MTIEEAHAHIGDGVVYAPAHGEREEGTITSVNDRFVFVRYGSRRTSAATDPAALFLLASPALEFARSVSREADTRKTGETT